jgi:hypothetical protein
MKRVVMAGAMVLALVGLAGAPIFAEVKTREKTAVKFEGFLGFVMKFGGKAAREGVVNTTLVKGDRKVTFNEQTGQIIDLGEEKIYDIDFRKKEYEVTTFAELRQKMKEAQEKARKQAENQPEQKQEAGKPEKEYEVDFDIKETGQKKQLAGYDAREVIMTVTVREKGKTLEQSGGLVMTADSWLGPKIPAMKEAAEFDLRYWKALSGDATMSAEQMAAVLAMFPLIGKAQERMRKENVNLDGTALATTMTFEGVKTKEQVAQESQQGGGGGGGLGGMLARKMMKRDEPKPRATIFTATHEVQEVSTTVNPADLQIPAGFKEKK